MKKLLSLFVVGLIFAPTLLTAQDPLPKEDEAIHNELRALRDKVAAALKGLDVDEILQYLHPDVVVTPMNAEVCRGHDQVRTYFDKMLSGPKKVVESVSIDFTVDSLTILYGDDAGVAYGGSNGHYKLTNGLEFDIQNQWTATLVKEGGKWLIASLHACANMFDNPLLDRVRRSLYWAGGVAAVVGLVLGVILTRIFKRRTSSTDSVAQ